MASDFTPQEIKQLRQVARDEEERYSCLGTLCWVVAIMAAGFGVATIILVFSHMELFRGG